MIIFSPQKKLSIIVKVFLMCVINIERFHTGSRVLDWNLFFTRKVVIIYRVFNNKIRNYNFCKIPLFSEYEIKVTQRSKS